ncbi:3-hydroxypropanoate dehydrogenase [Kushneria sinocarnis]|uniref:Putative NADH dehydrogenase/NAD(P)H nitroreductase C7446_0817 n=1 Tax=Kushneria sinocarnis TaxID=595502 RepID=A0A420WZN4_9GAMM|nr:malonic semialdehyde reductase [Kushneria sinocarnis]RKR06818.1 3-hydroxypropanoate dehydrogenase [Kushneria sinocarnis]
MDTLPRTALEQLFLNARSLHEFTDEPVAESTLRELYDIVRMAPTSMNCQPARFVFVSSDSARQRLADCVVDGNRRKVLGAPVVAIVAWDTRFFEFLPTQFPVFDAKPMYENDPAFAEETAFRNSSMQGGYLIMAARALGLACGPMSGFDQAAVNAEFFPDGRYRVNFLCNLGVGKPESAYPRGPRLSFDEAASIV